jgi:hypothetical protein
VRKYQVGVGIVVALGNTSTFPFASTNRTPRFAMTTALETGLIILLLSLIAICIAILGDHVTQALNRYDSWPTNKRERAKRSLSSEA